MKENISQYVARLKNGDVEVFTKLFEATQQRAYYTAFKILGNKEDAEDMVQEAYMQAYNSISQLKDDTKFEAWLIMILTNKCKRRLQKKKPNLFSEYENDDFDESFEDSLETTDSSGLPAEVLDNKALAKQVMDCIDKLPEEQKICVLLRYYDDLKIGEIASSLEIPEGTVKSRLNKARKTLKVEFEAIEKRDKIKLHGIPFIFLLGKGFADDAIGFNLSSSVASVIAQASGHGISSAAGSAASTANVTTASGSAAAGTTTAGLSVTAKIVIVVVSVALAVTGAVTANHFLSDKPEQEATTAIVSQVEDVTAVDIEVEEESGDYSNAAVAVKDDQSNTLYYIADDGIHMRDKDGKDVLLISDKPQNLIFNKRLYYIVDGVLYQLKDSERMEVMPLNADMLYGGKYLIAVNSSEGKAYRVNLNDKTVEEYSLSGSDFTYHGDYFYIRQKDGVSRQSTDDISAETKTQKAVDYTTKEKVALPYFPVNDTVYYTQFDSDENGIIYKKDVAAGKTEQIKLKQGIRDFAVVNGALYYSFVNGGLYKYQDGKNDILVDKGKYYCLRTSKTAMIWCSAENSNAFLLVSGDTKFSNLNVSDSVEAFEYIDNTLYVHDGRGYKAIQ